MENKRQNERDFLAETQELLALYPEILGSSLPREVVEMAMEGMSLLEAYEHYIREKNRARAPVTGTAGGEAVNEKGEDAFLRGFNKNYR